MGKGSKDSWAFKDSCPVVSSQRPDKMSLNPTRAATYSSLGASRAGKFSRGGSDEGQGAAESPCPAPLRRHWLTCVVRGTRDAGVRHSTGIFTMPLVSLSFLRIELSSFPQKGLDWEINSHAQIPRETDARTGVDDVLIGNMRDCLLWALHARSASLMSVLSGDDATDDKAAGRVPGCSRWLLYSWVMTWWNPLHHGPQHWSPTPRASLMQDCFTVNSPFSRFVQNTRSLVLMFVWDNTLWLVYRSSDNSACLDHCWYLGLRSRIISNCG